METTTASQKSSFVQIDLAWNTYSMKDHSCECNLVFPKWWNKKKGIKYEQSELIQISKLFKTVENPKAQIYFFKCQKVAKSRLIMDY